MRSWADICADQTLRDLPYKIETNRFDQIVMSPASTWHGGFQIEIGVLLKKLMPAGRVINECAIETSDGIKVPDVVWISRDRYAPFRRAFSLPIAPEICVEILSNSNSRPEINGKMQLYFARGAEEVWLCDDEGHIEFFHFAAGGSIPASVLCPEFPLKIDWD